jgi:hypothetical protein
MPRTHKPRTRRAHVKPEALAKLDAAPRAPERRVHGGRRGALPPGPKAARSARGDESSPDRFAAREPFRVPPAEAVVRTPPASLPETPRESHGLFELVPTVARRALELGLSAREPSFHAFVAAAPEVMIEDDIVRYATRFSGSRPTPNDIVYVHDFDQPEAPRPLCLPPGQGPVLVATMDALIGRL